MKTKKGYYTHCLMDMKTGKSKFVGFEKIPWSDKFYDFIWSCRLILFILILIGMMFLYSVQDKILIILLAVLECLFIFWLFKCQRVVD